MTEGLQLHELVEFAVDARDFGSHRGQIGSPRHSQAIYLAGEFVAEFLEQLELHQMSAQAVQHRCLQLVNVTVPFSVTPRESSRARSFCRRASNSSGRANWCAEPYGNPASRRRLTHWSLVSSTDERRQYVRPVSSCVLASSGFLGGGVRSGCAREAQAAMDRVSRKANIGRRSRMRFSVAKML
jgi:hypothetical protein